MRRALLGVLAVVVVASCDRSTASDAVADCPSQLRLATDDEPGARLLVTAEVSRAGQPVAGVRAELYQADAHGYYRQGPDGRELGRLEARLQGAVCTGADGRVRIESVQPASYPNNGPPAHVHVYMKTGERRTRDLTFELDDPVCTPAAQAEDGVMRCHLEVALD